MSQAVLLSRECPPIGNKLKRIFILSLHVRSIRVYYLHLGLFFPHCRMTRHRVASGFARRTSIFATRQICRFTSRRFRCGLRPRTPAMRSTAQFDAARKTAFFSTRCFNASLANGAFFSEDMHLEYAARILAFDTCVQTCV